MGFFQSGGILNRRGFFGMLLPTQISNLGLWLDANAGVTYDGSNLVSQWNDQSGNARNVTQSTTSRKPTFLSNYLNGKPVIDFYGSSSTANVLAGTDFMFDAGAASVFVVLASNNPVNPAGGNAYLISERSPAPVTTYGIVAVQQTALTKLNALIQGGSPVTQFLPFEIPDGYGTAYDQTWRITTSIDTGTSFSGYVNGVLGATAAYTRGALTSPTELFIGAVSSAAVGYFNAKVAEIIIYTRALEGLERLQVENYLRNKWGL